MACRGPGGFSLQRGSYTEISRLATYSFLFLLLFIFLTMWWCPVSTGGAQISSRCWNERFNQNNRTNVNFTPSTRETPRKEISNDDTRSKIRPSAKTWWLFLLFSLELNITDWQVKNITQYLYTMAIVFECMHIL